MNHIHEVSRWSFLLNEANSLGSMMAIGISASLYFILAVRRRWVKLVLGLVIIPIMIYVLWKTDSRASLIWMLWALIVACGAILYRIYIHYGSPKYFWISICSILTLVVGLVYGLVHQDIIKHLRISQVDITTGRAAIWELYFKSIAEHPWLGFGFGATGQFLTNHYPHSPLNVYIGLLGEAGLLGALPFILLWLGSFVLIFRLIKSNIGIDDNRVALASFALMIIGGYALQQNGEWTIMRISIDHYLFFFTVALVFSLNRAMSETTTAVSINGTME